MGVMFQGEMTTASELHRRYPIYSRSWLRLALADGCQSLEDLAKRWAES